MTIRYAGQAEQPAQRALQSPDVDSFGRQELRRRSRGGCGVLLEIQNELAIERGAQADFSRLLWIPPGLQVDDERQRKVIEQLRMDSRFPKGTDPMETYLDDLRTVCQERLRDAKKSAPKASGPIADPENPAGRAACIPPCGSPLQWKLALPITFGA
jgi:hypothetical protein